MSGLHIGFHVGYNYQTPSFKGRRNMASAIANPDVVRDYLATECELVTPVALSKKAGLPKEDILSKYLAT